MTAIAPTTTTEPLSAPILSSSNTQSSLASSSAAANPSTLSSSVVSNSTASVILSTVSLPAGSSYSSPPLSTDTIQLLTDLSSGNFTAAKSDVTKVQQDLQSRPAAVSTSAATAAPTSTTLLKQLNSLKESLESGDTTGALSILTNILSQSSSFAGSILNTTA